MTQALDSHRDRQEPAYPAVLAPMFSVSPSPTATLPVSVTVSEPAPAPAPAPRAVQLSPASHGVPPHSPQPRVPLAGGWRHPDPGRYAVPADIPVTNRSAAPEPPLPDTGPSRPGSSLVALQRQVVQREAEPAVDAGPTVAEAPATEPAAVTSTSEPATITSTPPPPPAEPPATPVPEELLKSLYDPLLRRLKNELRRDRERRSAVTDPPIRPI